MRIISFHHINETIANSMHIMYNSVHPVSTRYRLLPVAQRVTHMPKGRCLRTHLAWGGGSRTAHVLSSACGAARQPRPVAALQSRLSAEAGKYRWCHRSWETVRQEYQPVIPPPGARDENTHCTQHVDPLTSLTGGCSCGWAAGEICCWAVR